MVQLAIPGDIEDLIDRQWARLAGAGTWFSGAERVGIAAAARGDRVAESAAQEAAIMIHDRPAEITREWLADLETRGLTLAQYVEILGIVSQLRAIDTFLFGVGAAQRPLPDPVDGVPTGETIDAARIDGGWVPTVGAAFPTTVLSSIPLEDEAMNDLHAVMYLAPTAGEGFTMANLHAVRDDMTRTQMEFVAARTSLVNDCFF